MKKERDNVVVEEDMWMCFDLSCWYNWIGVLPYNYYIYIYI
jgi:hypothetical protein